MNNEVRIHGYLCKSETYDSLELYNKPPKRITFGCLKYWTYSSGDESQLRVLPKEIMPELKWKDEPVEVELVMSVEKVNK